MLGVNTVEFFLKEIYMNIEFSSQSRIMLLFLTTNMTAVRSRANQQYHPMGSSLPSWNHPKS